MNSKLVKGWEKQYDKDEVFYFSRSADQKKWIASLLSSQEAAIRREISEKLEGMKKKRATPMSWEADYNQALTDAQSIVAESQTGGKGV